MIVRHLFAAAFRIKSWAATLAAGEGSFSQAVAGVTSSPMPACGKVNTALGTTVCLRASKAALGTSLLFSWSTATAQVSAGAEASAPIVEVPTSVSDACQVLDLTPAQAPPGGAAMLAVLCGTHGVTLGPADQYSASTTATSGSVLVIRKRNGRTDVMLASPVASGLGVHVDNVTRELTKLGGRAPDLGLGDLIVDVTRFAIDGSVGVTVGGATKWLDLSSYASRATTMYR